MKNIISKKSIVVILVLLVFVILILKKLLFTDVLTPDSQTGKSERILKVSYIVANKINNTSSLTINGSLLSNEEVDLRTQVSGKITKINFTEGDKVKKGQLLIKINDLELQAQKAKIEVKLKLAKDREFRQKILLDKSLSSQQEYDVILNDLNAQIADLQLIDAQIEKTEIIAPFDGIIGLKTVSLGSYVSPDVKIATIQNYDIVKIDFSIPQKYAQFIYRGEKLKFTLPSVKNSFEATIYAVEPRIDPNSRTLQVRAKTTYNSKLISGSYVELEVPISDNAPTIFIPSQVVVPDISGQLVYVFKDGKAKQINVLTGIRNEKEVEIIDGVAEGDTIIASGLLLMKDGIKVQLQHNSK